MRRRVRFLEDEVKRKQEQAEKPYEQAKTEKSKVNKLFIIFLFSGNRLLNELKYYCGAIFLKKKGHKRYWLQHKISN